MSDTYTIVEATQDDIEDLCYMVKEFHSNSPYSIIPWDEDAFRSYLGGVAATGLVLVLKDVDGYAYGTIGFEWGSVPFNEHFYVYMEKWFYVKPSLRNTGAGIQLIQKAEEEIKERADADMVVLATLSTSPEHVAKWYGTKGYDWVESSYVKGVG